MSLVNEIQDSTAPQGTDVEQPSQQVSAQSQPLRDDQFYDSLYKNKRIPQPSISELNQMQKLLTHNQTLRDLNTQLQ